MKVVEIDLAKLREARWNSNEMALATFARLKESIHKYEKPSVTADIVIYTIQNNELKILLVKRGIEPFKDKWAIPGGFVRIHESLEDAAKRELQEETGVKDVYLEQLYGTPAELPFSEIIEESTGVRTVVSEVHWEDRVRYSNRRQHKMNLGGLLGRQEFAGSISPNHLDLLGFASIFHLGKTSTFGHGKIEVRANES